MKLYYAETLNPRKACAVAKYLKADVDFVHVDLARGENRTPEFLALNPNGKVPAIEHDGHRIWESATLDLAFRGNCYDIPDRLSGAVDDADVPVGVAGRGRAAGGRVKPSLGRPKEGKRMNTPLLGLRFTQDVGLFFA